MSDCILFFYHLCTRIWLSGESQKTDLQIETRAVYLLLVLDNVKYMGYVKPFCDRRAK